MKDLLIWECRRRLRLLRRFRELVVTYFSNTESSWMAEDVLEGETARRVRPEINRMLQDIIRIINSAGVSTVMYYAPPPAVGGFAGDVELMTNIFDLHSFHR